MSSDPLFQPYRLKHLQLKNRLIITSHEPAYPEDGMPKERYRAYHVERARAGVAMIQSRLASETVGKETYWYAPPLISDEIGSPTAHLLPFVDEYTVAYRDRDAVLLPEYNALVESGNVIFHAPFLIDGRVAGMWTRKVKKDTVAVAATEFRPLSEEERRTLAMAANHLGGFLGLTAKLV